MSRDETDPKVSVCVCVHRAWVACWSESSPWAAWSRRYGVILAFGLIVAYSLIRAHGLGRAYSLGREGLRS